MLGVVLAHRRASSIATRSHNLAARNIKTGFDFLGREAGFEIGETLIAYSPAASYARALLVGFLNTLQVADHRHRARHRARHRRRHRLAVAQLARRQAHRRLHPFPAQHPRAAADRALVHDPDLRALPAGAAPGRAVPRHFRHPARHLFPRAQGARRLDRGAARASSIGAVAFYAAVALERSAGARRRAQRRRCCCRALGAAARRAVARLGAATARRPRSTGRRCAASTSPAARASRRSSPPCCSG